MIHVQSFRTALVWELGLDVEGFVQAWDFASLKGRALETAND
jgi:hypothetical protein